MSEAELLPWSLSCRIAEGFLSKEQPSLSLQALADLAVAAGYEAICMRASQIGIDSAPDRVSAARRLLQQRGLGVSMVTGDFDIVYNNDRGPDCLRNIDRYLDLAAALDAPLIRVCLKHRDDIPIAKRAAARAADRGRTLVHQCHVQSLFETVDQSVDTLEAIDHPAFGLIYEPANLELCGQDYGPPSIQRLAPWIRNVYVQNQVIHSNGRVTLETWCRGPVRFDVTPIHHGGGIDFASVVAGLKRIGYHGPITVHQSGPEDAPIRATEQATEQATDQATDRATDRATALAAEAAGHLKRLWRSLDH